VAQVFLSTSKIPSLLWISWVVYLVAYLTSLMNCLKYNVFNTVPPKSILGHHYPYKFAAFLKFIVVNAPPFTYPEAKVGECYQMHLIPSQSTSNPLASHVNSISKIYPRSSHLSLFSLLQVQALNTLLLAGPLQLPLNLSPCGCSSVFMGHSQHGSKNDLLEI
jgi:hypothetical protein